VIVIAIDGLRQDVLYPSGEQQVNEPGASYFVPLGELDGFRSVLGGGVDVDAYADLHHERVCGVSAVYPSITLASWASIFTGSPPSETGILGNEFFIRSGTSEIVSAQDSRHMITLSEGAFARNATQTANLAPVGIDGFVADPLEAGQNQISLFAALPVRTLYEQLTAIEGDTAELADALRGTFSDLGHDTSVVAQNHYARGASTWLTMTAGQQLSVPVGLLGDRGVPGAPSVAERLDAIPTTNFRSYISSNFMDFGVRNGEPFPPLSVLYLAGLDHHAHSPGHGVAGERYGEYFQSELDGTHLPSALEGLRQAQEFHNKIFVITTDHGHTQISDLQSADQYPCSHHDPSSNLGSLGGYRVGLGEDAAALVGMKDQDSRTPELANQNLQIWELARLIQLSFDFQSAFRPRLLLPPELGAEVERLEGVAMPRGKGADVGVGFATGVAALNGGMAHLYLRPANSPDWSHRPSARELAVVAETIRVFLMGGRVAPGDLTGGFVPPDHAGYAPLSREDVRRLIAESLRFPALSNSVDTLLVRNTQTNDYEVFRRLAPSSDPEHFELETSPLSSLPPGEFVYAVERIEEMNSLDRSGDLILVMRNRTGEPSSKRFSSGVPCNGWHAGINRADSYVPFIVSNPGGNLDIVDVILDTVCGTDRSCGSAQPAHSCLRSSDLPRVVRTILESEYVE
jgi:hypothetical protein